MSAVHTECSNLDIRLREWLNRNWNDRLMDLVRDGVYVINLDGTIVRSNSTFRYSWETMHGDWHDNLFSPRMQVDDHMAVRTCHQHMIEGGMGGRTIRRFLARDGSTECYDVSESPIRSGDRLWGIIGVTRPTPEALTDPKRSMGILSVLNARAGNPSGGEVQTDILDERDRLEHVLRSSLGLIRGYAFALDRYPDLSRDRQQRFIGYIKFEAERLSRWLDQAMAAESLTAKRLPVERVSLVEAIRATAHHIEEYAFRRGITVEQRIPDTLPDIQASRQVLANVLDTVLDNALSLTPPSGKITVATSQTDREIAVAVSDEWLGEFFPEDANDDHPNATTEDYDRADGAAGLDLAAAKRLTESMGGKIGVTTIPGKGTTFTLTFPKVDPVVQAGVRMQ